MVYKIIPTAVALFFAADVADASPNQPPTSSPTPPTPGFPTGGTSGPIAGGSDCMYQMTSATCLATSVGGEACRWQGSCGLDLQNLDPTDPNYMTTMTNAAMTCSMTENEGACNTSPTCKWSSYCREPASAAEQCNEYCQTMMLTDPCGAVRCAMKCPGRVEDTGGVTEGPDGQPMTLTQICQMSASMIGCTDPTACVAPPPTKMPTFAPSNPGDTSQPTPEPTKFNPATFAASIGISGASTLAISGVSFAAIAAATWFVV